MKSLTIKNLLVSFFWAIAIPLILGFAYYLVTDSEAPDSLPQMFILYLIGWAIMVIIFFIFYCILACMLYVLLEVRKMDKARSMLHS